MMLRTATLFALLASGSIARADTSPAFQLVRADEDWSALRNAPNAAPWFKYIALNDGSAYLSLGGEVRERLDAFDATRFGIGRVADDYLLQRVLVHADLHFGDRVRVFAQLGREDAIGKKPPLSVSDTDRGDVQNLFIDVILDDAQHTQLRFGRQELIFNPTQRFVSVREGPNVRQSFDGVQAKWHDGDWNVDLFATRPVLYKIGAFDDHSDDTQAFYGAYASKKLGATVSLDFYWFGLRRNAVQFGTVHADEHRDSAGARIAGSSGDFDYDTEAMTQWGQFGQRDISAWAASAIAGYTLHSAWSPRLGLEFDAGSGDHGKSGALGTFNPLFPKGAYFDESALISWANSVIVRPSLSVQPTRTLSLRASVIARWREDAHDAVYLQPYVPLAATLGNRAREVGQAYELDATWRLGRAWVFAGEVAHERAGPAITRAGGRDADFFMFSAQYRY